MAWQAWHAFAAGWVLTLVLWALDRWWCNRRHARDLRLLRHMAQGQARLQRELAAVDASRCVH